MYYSFSIYFPASHIKIHNLLPIIRKLEKYNKNQKLRVSLKDVHIKYGLKLKMHIKFIYNQGLSTVFKLVFIGFDRFSKELITKESNYPYIFLPRVLINDNISGLEVGDLIFSKNGWKIISKPPSKYMHVESFSEATPTESFSTHTPQFLDKVTNKYFEMIRELYKKGSNDLSLLSNDILNRILYYISKPNVMSYI